MVLKARVASRISLTPSSGTGGSRTLRPAASAARARFESGRVILRVTTNSMATRTIVSAPNKLKSCQGSGGTGGGARTRNVIM